MGLVKGEGELDPAAHKLEGAGFAVAQTAQITPEIGVFVTPTLMISGQLRAQYVGGTNGKPGSVAGLRRRHVLHAGQRRLRRLREGDLRCSPTRPSASRSAARSAAATSATRSSSRRTRRAGRPPRAATQTCVDTLAGGPFLIGPTFGFFYELGDTVDLIVAVNSALGVPKFTLNFDVGARHRLSHLAFAHRPSPCLVNETDMLRCRACPRTATRHRPRERRARPAPRGRR